jgi:uncharacterized membrane protein
MAKEWLIVLTESAVVAIDALALIVIVLGTIEAVFAGIRVAIESGSGHERRYVWLRYSRWLVAGLTFQLAADIIETSVSTSWDAVGRIAAVAVIRTFLNYFLERDANEVRAREREGEKATV